jgi:sulfur carrier protein
MRTTAGKPNPNPGSPAAGPLAMRLNGRPTTVAPGVSLADLARGQGVDRETRGVAIALNGRVVPRSSWADTDLNAGDHVEIVRAAAGG